MAIHDEATTRPPGSGMALASLVTGIVAILACGLGVIAGPVAVVLGVVSGRRSGFGGKQIGGIVTGAFAFIVSAVALVAFMLFLSGRNDPKFIQPPVITINSDETAQPTPDATAAGTLLTEAGIAESGYETAYAAYLDTYGVSVALDGIYRGDAIDTPCFTMDGEPWWITQGEPDTCGPSSELWWEYAADSAVPEITLFGAGGGGAMIDFVPMETEKVMALYSSAELSVVSSDVRDSMMPGYGCTDIVETPITLGGLPAVQLDCTLEGYAAYRIDVVMLPEPRLLDDGTSISGFFVEGINEAEWIYRSEDVFSRLENTLVWK